MTIEEHMRCIGWQLVWRMMAYHHRQAGRWTDSCFKANVLQGVLQKVSSFETVFLVR